MAVTNAGGVSPVGTVDVMPLVSQVDGQGNAIPHGTIHACPYLRIQGGANAVILDPQVGDIGIAVVCDRDTSAVEVAKGAAPPGSKRRHDLADAVYLSTIIGQAPTQYVEFASGGITITSPVGVTINGNVQVNGTVTSTGNMKAGTIDLETHVHTGVTGGSSNTGGPTG
ncbi:MAG: baseplate assembly protein [Rhodospirillales bacterium]|nr:baseplate assembly protein [Rhodospirillales bacterium]